MRKFSKSRYGQPGTTPLITCRGPLRLKTFSHIQMVLSSFDEDYQFRRRYVRFNLDALCRTAAIVGGDSNRVTAIDKMEGGFSKAFLMKTTEGADVIAKIPCRIAGPPSLTTAGEVGVLEYVKRYKTIPVPRVFKFSWSADGSNAVGAEYIVMEKAPGIPLFQVWGTMPEFDRLHLIKNLTELEAQLAAIKFPAYGGLYLRKDTDMSKKNQTPPLMLILIHLILSVSGLHASGLLIQSSNLTRAHGIRFQA
ncbi:hypothetical protein N7528_002713 [Penicillium herquei]|nr:hypothetical protein N7528_002713 [Penicillium herquei]